MFPRQLPIALLITLMLLSACASTSSPYRDAPNNDHLSGLSAEARAIIFLNTLPDLDAYEHLGEVRCQVLDFYHVVFSRCRAALREEAAALGGSAIVLTSQFDDGHSFVELYGEVFRPKARTPNALD